VEKQDNFRSSFSTEARYRMLVDAVTDYAIYMLDPDGFVVSWNSGAHRLKGYTEEEIIGSHFSKFYAEEDVRGGLPARALATAAREGRFENEGWRVRKDGGRFWAHVVVDPIWSPTGELVGYAKVTRDLSERRAAEEALRLSDEQFKLLVQGVTDYAIYMLDTNGTVSSWNSGAQRIKGYLPEEIIGSNFSRFYRPEDIAQGLPAKTLETAVREGRFESEGWRVRKDGSQFWANVVVDPIKRSDGEIIGFAKITRDVTEKRDAQLALERARETLVQSQKMDAIGQLTGGVAHDFNNLLMVILSSLELLRRRLSDDEKARRLVDNAVQGAKRGATLAQRMLAFARRQELRPLAVNVASLVQGMRDLLERSLGPTIQIESEFPEGLPPVLIDSNQLELAMLNLAVNARDAMPQGGRLFISARERAVAGDTRLASGQYVCLSLSDTGSGMDAEILRRATEPFFTTKGTGKGTGLGLAMVHGLAAQSGGTFVLSSTPSVGTTAELWLPVAASGIEANSIEATSLEERQGNEQSSLVVVVVDDDALVLAGTVSMLEDLGHDVLPAASAAEALSLVLGNDAVSLVVTDQVMPGMTGAELIERLRKERPRVPVILATGFGEVPEGLDRMALRLPKPYGQDSLAQAIRKVFADSVARRPPNDA
jgi:PAS domain S-box-containing protein